MKRILPERPLSQTEKNRRWTKMNNAKSTNFTLVLSDPDERVIYDFLSTQKSKRQTIVKALKLYMETLDK